MVLELLYRLEVLGMEGVNWIAKACHFGRRSRCMEWRLTFIVFFSKLLPQGLCQIVLFAFTLTQVLHWIQILLHKGLRSETIFHPDNSSAELCLVRPQ